MRVRSFSCDIGKAKIERVTIFRMNASKRNEEHQEQELKISDVNANMTIAQCSVRSFWYSCVTSAAPCGT